MDVQLQELIDKIKAEGVQQAQAKSEQIIEEAQSSAGSIVAEAKKEAASIVEAAKAEADRAAQAGRDALAQAGRDLLLGLRRHLEKLFAQVVEAEVAEGLGGEVLERAILSVFDSMSAAEPEHTELNLSETDAARLSSRLMAKLGEKVRSGVTITPSPRISAGFRVSVENGTAYYNFSPREIAEVLAAFLNPRLAEALDSAVSEE